ncbi:MAG: LamG-like jellyroll fold domain-containing protein [Bacilli bacterium]|nr:LamG-like jellyroll fold domain-containing protein [Bacilli bacterium]
MAGDNTASEAKCNSPTFAATTAGTNQTPAYNVWPYNRSVYKRQLTVSYNGNGNTGGSTADTSIWQYFNSGLAASSAQITSNSITLANNGFVKTGHTFKEWNTKADGTGTAYAQRAAFTEIGATATDTTVSKTLYAIWTPNPYVAKFLNGNLMSDKELVNNGATLTRTNATTYTMTTASTTAGAYIPASEFTAGKKYLLMFKVQKTAGTWKNIGGHSAAASQISFTIDGAAAGGTYASPGTNMSSMNNTSVHTVEFEFTYNGGASDNNIYIQPNRSLADSITVNITDFMLFEVVENRTVTYGQPYGTMPTVSRTGFTLSGWYDNYTNGNSITATTNVSIASNHRIYTRWAENSITISYNLNGGSLSTSCGSGANPTSVKFGVDARVCNPTRSGWTFAGWTSSSGDGLDTSTAKTGATASSYTNWTGSSTTNTYFKNLRSAGGTVTLTAHWSKTITITFMKNGAYSQTNASGTAVTDASVTRTCTMIDTATSCTIKSPTIVAASGFTVVGYNTTASATTSSWNHNTDKNVSADATYYAITMSSSPCTVTPQKNISAATGSPSALTCYRYNGSSSCTVTAWAANAYTYSPWTIISWKKTNDTTTTTYAETQKTGDASPGASLTCTANTNAVAIWRKNVTVTYNSNGCSSSNATATGYAYNGGSTVGVTSVPTAPTMNSGWTFKGYATSNTAQSGTTSGSMNLSAGVSSTSVTGYQTCQASSNFTGTWYYCNSGIKSTTVNCSRYNGATSCSVNVPLSTFNGTTCTYGGTYIGYNKSSVPTTTVATNNNSTETLTANTNFFVNYRKPVSVYYPNATTCAAPVTWYRHEYFTSTSAMNTVISNGTTSLTAISPSTFGFSNLKETFLGLSSAVNSTSYNAYNSDAVVKSTTNAFYVVTGADKTANFHYYDDSDDGAIASTTATCNEKYVCKTTSSQETKYCTFTVPDIAKANRTKTESQYAYRGLTSFTAPTGNSCYSQAALGDYISYTPSMSSYKTNKLNTGYTSNQTITPSELSTWRVISKDSTDNTMEAISDKVSSTSVYLSGKTGYRNLVQTLNNDIAQQYINSTFVSNARYFGYDGQSGIIPDTNFVYPAPWTCNTGGSCAPDEDLGGGDDFYTSDYNLVNTVLGSRVASKVGGSASPYWMASRNYDYIQSGAYTWDGRAINTSGALSEKTLYFSESAGVFDYGIENASIRPIVKLKSNVLCNSGTGTSSSPRVLTASEPDGGASVSTAPTSANLEWYSSYSKTSTVTYNGNNNTGGTVPSVQTLTTYMNAFGSVKTPFVDLSSTALTRTGYESIGWNTEDDGSGDDYSLGSTYSSSENLNLYTKWKDNRKTVTFEGNGGTNQNMEGLVYKFDGIYNMPSNTHYYNTTTSYSNGLQYWHNMANDVVVYASGTWEDKDFRLSGPINNSGQWVNLGVINTDYVTLNITFELTSMPSDYAYIIGNGNSGGSQIFVSSSGLGCFRIWGDGEWKHVCTPNNTIQANKKYNIVGTYDGEVLKIYLDGELINSLEFVGIIPDPQNNNHMGIGCQVYGTDDCNGYFMTGKVYNAAIFDRALTSEEIAEDYGKHVAVGGTYGTLPTPLREGYTFGGWYKDITVNSSTGVITYSNPVTSSTSVTTSTDHTLYAKWTKNPVVHFEGNGGTNQNEEGLIAKYDGYYKNANNNYFGYATWVDMGTGRFSGIASNVSWGANGNLVFNGTNTNVDTTWVQINPMPAFTVETTFSISEWPASGGYKFVIGNTDNSAGGFGIYLNSSGYICFNAYINGTSWNVYVPTQKINLNEKHTITGTYDGSAIKAYLDGKLAASKEVTGSISVPANNNTALIGCYGSAGTCSNYYFKGNIYNAAIYSRALSAEEIAEDCKDFVKGSTYEDLPTPVRDGYTFDGWYKNISYNTSTGEITYSNPVTSTTTVTTEDDHSLYAKWTEKIPVFFQGYSRSLGHWLDWDSYYNEANTHNTSNTSTWRGLNLNGSSVMSADISNGTWNYNGDSDGLYFNGTNTGVNLKYAPTVNYAISLGATFKATLLDSSTRQIMGNIEGAGASLFINSSNKLEFCIYSGGYRCASTNTAISVNEKYSAYGYYSGKYIKLYLNGRLVSVTKFSGQITQPTNGTKLHIGCNPGASGCTGEYFKGYIYHTTAIIGFSGDVLTTGDMSVYARDAVRYVRPYSATSPSTYGEIAEIEGGRSEYSQDGWYPNSSFTNGTMITPETPVTATAAHTIYAKWSQAPPSARISIVKDNSAWSSSGINAALYQSGTQKYAYSAATKSGSTITWENITPGTYDVWIAKDSNHKTTLVDSGMDIVISQYGLRTVTARYYTMTLSTSLTDVTINGTAVSNGGTVIAAAPTTTATSNIEHIVASPSTTTAYTFDVSYSGASSIINKTINSEAVKIAAAGTLTIGRTPFNCGAANTNVNYMGQSWYVMSKGTSTCELALNKTVGNTAGNKYSDATNTTGTVGVYNYIKSLGTTKSNIAEAFNNGSVTNINTNSSTAGTVTGAYLYWYGSGYIKNNTGAAINNYSQNASGGQYYYYDGSWSASAGVGVTSGSPGYLTGSGIDKILVYGTPTNSQLASGGTRSGISTTATTVAFNTSYSTNNTGTSTYLAHTINQFGWNSNTNATYVYFTRYRYSYSNGSKSSESVENRTVQAKKWYFKACGGTYNNANRLRVEPVSSSAAHIYNYYSKNTSNFSSGAYITMAGGYTSSTGSNTSTRVYNFYDTTSSRCVKRRTFTFSSSSKPIMYRPHITVAYTTATS